MSVRQEEIKRLEQYAKGLGVKVSYRKQKKNDPQAAWVVDGSEIILYTSNRQSATKLILNFCHELSHHKSWIKCGRIGDLKTNHALILDDERERGDPPLPKSKRKLIYETEKNDALLWDEIIAEVGIKITKKRVELEREMDVWMYEYYYKKGEYPTGKQVREKKKLVRKKIYGND